MGNMIDTPIFEDDREILTDQILSGPGECRVCGIAMFVYDADDDICVECSVDVAEAECS